MIVRLSKIVQIIQILTGRLHRSCMITMLSIILLHSLTMFARFPQLTLETLLSKLWACSSFFYHFCDSTGCRGVAASVDAPRFADPSLSSKPERQLPCGGTSSRLLGRSFPTKSGFGSNLPMYVNFAFCAVCCMWRRAKLWLAMVGGEKWGRGELMMRRRWRWLIWRLHIWWSMQRMSVSLK